MKDLKTETDFRIGEVICQMAFQFTEKQISDEELKFNCCIASSIGDIIKLLSEGIKPNYTKLQNNLQAICDRQFEFDSFSIRDLLHFTDILFTSDYKERLSAFNIS